MVGSKAPALLVEKWLKGEPVESFVEGQVYLVDFWSTGCFPCIESIPHLSELQARYQEKLIVIGVSIREGGEDNREYGEETTRRVQDFLHKLGDKANFRFALDGPKRLCDLNWMEASGNAAIPTSFLVDQQGRIAHIGHPASKNTRETIDKLLADEWDIEKARERFIAKFLEEKEFKKGRALVEAGKFEEGMAVFDALVIKSESWKNTVLFETFPVIHGRARYDQALEVVPELLNGPANDSLSVLYVIADLIAKMPEQDRQAALPLAMRAAKRSVEINSDNYPGPYDLLARIQWISGDRQSAIENQRKAIEVCQPEHRHNFEPKLQEYLSDSESK